MVLICCMMFAYFSLYNNSLKYFRNRFSIIFYPVLLLLWFTSNTIISFSHILINSSFLYSVLCMCYLILLFLLVIFLIVICCCLPVLFYIPSTQAFFSSISALLVYVTTFYIVLFYFCSYFSNTFHYIA